MVQHFDEGHEQEALQSIQVQVVWRAITCDDNDHIIVPERFKQPRQNHGVRDVEDLELVDAEYLHVLTELVSHHVDCVLSLSLKFFVNYVLFLVDLKHELLVV